MCSKDNLAPEVRAEDCEIISPAWKHGCVGERKESRIFKNY